jgi:hypothetical protein
MSSVAHSFSEHEEMLKSFRCQDLANLLAYAGQSKNGKKMELYDRCLNILKKGNANVQLKIREIYNSNSPDPNSMIMNGRYPGTNYSNSNFNHQYSGNVPGAYGSMHSGSVHPSSTQNTRSGIGSLYQNSLAQIRVQFEKLAFYEFLHELHVPLKLQPSNPHTRPHAICFNFFMTTDQANEITGTRELINGKLEYSKQIHLRFGHYEQNAQPDNLPANLAVNLNSKPAQLPQPKPTSKPNADIIRPGRSIDVTSLCRLAPNMANKVELNWSNPDQSKQYCIGVYVFKKLTCKYLLSTLKTKYLPTESTRQMVREKLQITDSDFEIETNDLKVSLMCPLMKFRMNLPGRATTCKHVQCFDLESYLMMNEKKPTWNCPVCDQNASYDNLIIDSLNQEIIKESGTDVEEVVFDKDGSWKKASAHDTKKSKAETKEKSDTRIDESCVELICDDSPEKEKDPQKSQNRATSSDMPPPAKKTNLCVIDLTLDSSDDDEDELPSTSPLQVALDNIEAKIESDSNAVNEQLDHINSKISDLLPNTNDRNINNNNNDIRSNKESAVAVSPSQSIISISSSNSSIAGLDFGSRSTTPTPNEQTGTSTNASKVNESPKKTLTPSHANVNKSASETPMDVSTTQQPRNENKNHINASKNTSPVPLSNSQLARGISIGKSSINPNKSSPGGEMQISPSKAPQSASATQPKISTYSNSFAKSSSSLTSIPSIIENTNLTNRNNATMPILAKSNPPNAHSPVRVNPSIVQKPTLIPGKPGITSRPNPQQSNSDNIRSSNNNPSHSNSNGNGNSSTYSLVNNQNNGNNSKSADQRMQSLSNVRQNEIKEMQRQQAHQANINRQRMLSHQQKTNLNITKNKNNTDNKQSTGFSHNNNNNRPQHMPQRPSERPNEHTLVGQNSILNRLNSEKNQKRSELRNNDSSSYNNSNRMKDKALLTITDELTSMASNPNISMLQAPNRQSQSQAASQMTSKASSSLTSRHPQNVNYNLKEASLSHKIDNTLKRNSFDTDLPQNTMNKKPNTNQTNPQQQQHQSRQIAMGQSSSSPHNHNKNLNQARQGMSISPNSPTSRGSMQYNNNSNNSNNSEPFFVNNNNNNSKASHNSNYSSHRTQSNQYSINNLHQHQAYNNQQKTPPNSNVNRQHSPASPVVSHQNQNNRHVYMDNSPNPHGFNSGVPNQYQYHTQNLNQNRNPHSQQQQHSMRQQNSQNL